MGIESMGIVEGSEAETRFSEAIQEFGRALGEDEKREALDEAGEAADDIEDDENRRKALEQVEKLRESI